MPDGFGCDTRRLEIELALGGNFRRIAGIERHVQRVTAPAATAVVIDEPRVCDPVEIAFERRHRSPVVTTTDERHPDILIELIGRRFSAGLPHQETIERSAVATVKNLER